MFYNNNYYRGNTKWYRKIKYWSYTLSTVITPDDLYIYRYISTAWFSGATGRREYGCCPSLLLIGPPAL
jgi:hypothetical protein